MSLIFTYTNLELCECELSRVPVFTTQCTVARQAPMSTEFSRQEYWSGLPFPPLGDLPHPGIQFISHALPALAGGVLFFF